ncbi:DASH complex subunit SPC19 [Entomortierella parvispora]|uniref:DASH complex subunit SPC19 n=1 Tax=Entomortierella parvispora TaxID=205924 RepID=A0A9P3LWE8_9FUNG|nr:DASH complex subunit SPC19 [Entomortierella parvispora]
MDAHGHNSTQGYSYGYGNSNAQQSYGYRSQRRTLAGGSQPYTSNSFLPSLKRCVSTLEMSTQLLRSSVSTLDEASSGYPRLKTITTHKKRFELVSEQDITVAHAEVAKDVEPKLHGLVEQAVQMVLALEGREHELLELVNAETEKEKLRAQRQSAARSGLSNIKRLQTLTKRKEDLSKRATDLDGVMEQKQKEFGELMRRSQGSQSSGPESPSKRIKKNPETRDLNRKKEAKKAEISRRSQELDAMQKKIEEQSRALRELRSKASQQSSQSDADGFAPNALWLTYSAHLHVLNEALEKPLEADIRDKATFEDAFRRILTAYLQELTANQEKTDKELDRLMMDKSKKLAQLRSLCKQLFPEDNIGLTMSRLMELLVESHHNEVYYKDVLMDEFPVEEDKRHNLSRVLPILTNIGVLELVQETIELDPNQEESPNVPRDQLVLKIRFEDSTPS